MEIMELAEMLMREKAESTELVNKLAEYGRRKCEAAVAYDRKLAVVEFGLKNGKEYDLDGEKIVSPPVTIIRELAKGICWKESLEAEQAETSFRNLNTKIIEKQTQINATQSINKHLSHL